MNIVDNNPLSELDDLPQDDGEKIEAGDWETLFDPTTFLEVGDLQKVFDQRLSATLGSSYAISKKPTSSRLPVAESIVKFNDEARLLI